MTETAFEIIQKHFGVLKEEIASNGRAHQTVRARVAWAMLVLDSWNRHQYELNKKTISLSRAGHVIRKDHATIRRMHIHSHGNYLFNKDDKYIIPFKKAQDEFVLRVLGETKEGIEQRLEVIRMDREALNKLEEDLLKKLETLK